MLLVAYRSGRQTRTTCLNAGSVISLRRRRVAGAVPRRHCQTSPWDAAALRPATTSSTKLAIHNLGRRFVVIDTDCAATTT